jgi:Fic family protein
MTYLTLSKAFHNPNTDADELYRTRFQAKDTIHMDLLVSGNPAFCVMDESVYVPMLGIMKADKKILSLTQSLPDKAIQQFTERTLIDEIVLTNEIEGVNSSRKEIGDVLRNLEKRNRRNRFYGLVNKYSMLRQKERIRLNDPKDIRELYDELVLEEVRVDNPNDMPDGVMFRKDPVSVYDVVGIEIHQGVQPEERIIEYLSGTLALLDNLAIEMPVRAALFHYLLGYIHPFYNGNGRLNRFISSYLLTQEYEPLVGFRLSYAVTKSISRYYKGFSICNDPLNRGDLTPFVIMFLDIIRQAVDEIVSVLSKKKHLLDENMQRLLRVEPITNGREVFALAAVLLQARMFSGDGITAQELMEIFNASRPTIMKRLSQIEAVGLLERYRIGRKVHLQINIDELSRR